MGFFSVVRKLLCNMIIKVSKAYIPLGVFGRNGADNGGQVLRNYFHLLVVTYILQCIIL